MSFDEIKHEKKPKPVVFPAKQSVFYEIKFYKINGLLDLKYEEKPQSVNLPRASSFVQ